MLLVARAPCFAISSPADFIIFSKSDLSVSYVVSKTNPVVSILFTLATNLSYSVLLTTSFFTTSLSLHKSTGTGANLSICSLSTSVFKPA